MNIVGIIFGFMLILILNYRDINLGFSIILGAIIGGLLSGIALLRLPQILLFTLRENTTIRLALMMILISGLGYILEQNDDLNIMVNSFLKIFNSSKPLIIIFPSLIATLFVPGGAILSAPMVDKSGDKIELSYANKTASNLFYRHIFFLVYPLYPSLIVAADLFDVHEFSLIKYNILITLVGLVVAYFMFFYNNDSKILVKENRVNINYFQEIRQILLSLSPIIIVLVLSLIFNVQFVISLFVATIWGFFKYLYKHKRDYKIIYNYFTNGINYNLVAVIIGVMIFKNVVEISGFSSIIANLLNQIGLPLIMIIPVLGLVVSFFLGSNIAALGILAPIFIPLFPANNLAPYLSFLFISTYIGYNLSPIHLCLVLTKEYFDISYFETYSKLVIPFAAMLFAAILQFLYLS